MASLAENNAYLNINGTDVSGYATVGKLDMSAESIDITAGFGQDWVQRAPGLKDATFDCTIAYDVTNVSTYIGDLEPGETAVTVIWCPEGNTAGKPKHEQSFVCVGNSGPQVDVKKEFVTFECKFEGAGTPTTNLYAGGVVA